MKVQLEFAFVVGDTTLTHLTFGDKTTETIAALEEVFQSSGIRTLADGVSFTLPLNGMTEIHIAHIEVTGIATAHVTLDVGFDGNDKTTLRATEEGEKALLHAHVSGSSMAVTNNYGAEVTFTWCLLGTAP